MLSGRTGRAASARACFLGLAVVLTVASAVTVANGAQAGGPAVDSDVASAVAGGGSTDFWVLFEDEADLSGADEISDWDKRGQYVYDRLTATADASQADLRKQLDAGGYEHRAFWISNRVLVRDGDAEALEISESDPGVGAIEAEEVYSIPEPSKGEREAGVNAVEWGIANINADDVWATHGVRGEGIVVGNIDTGVDFDHPALVGEYRGNLGSGTFDHNYNWFDGTAVCPAGTPCDNNNHGTHTMGTMVGDDGGANQIGVAPNAEWIAAKGCATNSCASTSLLAAGQWMLAPTNLSGANPDPSKRPHLINNSWGGSGGDTWYQATINAWTAAGIFGSFSNGNTGPACNTAGSPGDNATAYGVGAYDISNAIASFSARGPGMGTEIRPSISGPGVNVRSSVNGGAYQSLNGTSMAAPHLAGAVALMWSAAPALIGDVAETQAILDDTAIDTSDLTCGGTADDNNVFGEGRLDALAAVNASPIGPSGAIAGTIRDNDTNAPIAGVTVSATDGGSPHTATTDANGHYELDNLPVGTYTLTGSKFAYKTKTVPGVVVSDGVTTNRNFRLVQQPTQLVSGTVRSGQPLFGATVSIDDTPLVDTTDASGHYEFAAVPNGVYTFTITYAGCANPRSLTRTVNGTEVFDVGLTRIVDAYGHRCDLEPTSWVDGTTPLALSGDDSSLAVSLPFSFSLYGTSYATVNVSTNGYISFSGPSSAFSNTAIPNTAVPNAALYPFWDDLIVASGAEVRKRTLGSAPNRRFVIEYDNVQPYPLESTERWDHEVVLYENGRALFQYRGIDGDRERGNSATVGIENAAGTDALEFSFNEASLSDGVALQFTKAGAGPF